MVSGTELFPSLQGVMEDADETIARLATDMEGREAVAGGIRIELARLRGGDLTFQDRELLVGLADDPIMSIKVLRELKQVGQPDAA